MKRKRIDQLANWPPEPGGAFDRGDILRAGPNEIVLTSFDKVRDVAVTFGGTFAGKERTFIFFAEDEAIANCVGEVIAKGIGRTLQDIGLAEIDVPESEKTTVQLRKPASVSRIRLENFKSIRHMDLDLKQRNVLVGANGAGKSNLISFFKMLNWMEGDRMRTWVGIQGGGTSVLHQGVESTRDITASLRFETERGENDYEFRLAHAGGDTLIFTEEKFQFRPAVASPPYRWTNLEPGQFESGLAAFSRTNKPGATTAGLILALRRRCAVYQFHNTSTASGIRNQADVNDNAYLSDDGDNLAPFLARLQVDSTPVYYRIRDAVRAVAPFFFDFVLESRSGKMLLRWQERGAKHIFGAHQASDGLLRGMALITLLLQPEDRLPGLLLIDEPELGQNPAAISLIAGLIKAASVRSQILVATQSRDLMGEFDPDDIVVVDRPLDSTRSGFSSRFRRLGEILKEEELAAWLEEYTMADLWSKNVIPARPA